MRCSNSQSRASALLTQCSPHQSSTIRLSVKYDPQVSLMRVCFVSTRTYSLSPLRPRALMLGLLFRGPSVVCSPPSNLVASLASPGNLSAVPTSFSSPITITIAGLDLASSNSCVSSGVGVTAGRWPWTLLSCNATSLVVQSGPGGGGGLEVGAENRPTPLVPHRTPLCSSCA